MSNHEKLADLYEERRVLMRRIEEQQVRRRHHEVSRNPIARVQAARAVGETCEAFYETQCRIWALEGSSSNEEER